MALFACKVGSTEGGSLGTIEFSDNSTFTINCNIGDVYVISGRARTGSIVVSGGNILEQDYKAHTGTVTYEAGMAVVEATANAIVVNNNDNVKLLHYIKVK